jgi:hypothetical protein
MKTTEYVLLKINKLPKGFVFTYTDFNLEEHNKEAVIKALNRMAASGKIAKLSKGKYYKPENSIFGMLEPIPTQVIKDLLEENGKITGYLTGYSMYNRLGLTTQVSNTIHIGKNQIRPRFKRDYYSIAFVKQKNTITKENIELLQILDSIRYIKKIPDTSMESLCKRFLAILNSIPDLQINTMMRLALKYSPATRALLGAFIDQLNRDLSTNELFKSLNPITKYNIPRLANVLGTSQKWNIV